MNTNRIITSVLFGAVAACGILDSVRDSSPLSFSILEGYIVDPPPPPPHIALVVATETEFPCAGYRLVSQLVVTGNVLRVIVSHRITKPEEACATVMAPAGFRVALPITVGAYTLEFARDGVTDRYSVTITETAIEIATIEAHFTTPTALRFPRGG
jgi:hypothetical protein